MKKNSFFKNAVILSFTALFLNIVSVIFRVYLSNKIGQSGMGLYQLIISVYVFGATVASSGLSFTVTRLVSEAVATKNEAKIRKIMKSTFILALIFGGTAFSGMFFGAEFIGTSLLGNSEVINCLKILAFGLPFMSLSSCFSGFFIGLRKVSFSSLIQVFEDLLQIAVAVILLGIFAPMGVEAACTAIVTGTAVGEILACLFAYLLYKYKGRTIKKDKLQKTKMMKTILSITLPMSFSSYLRSALTTVENLMIPISLQKYGYSQADALGLFGLLKGMVIPIIFFPAVFLSAFSRLLMPEIADARAVGDNKKIDQTGGAVISATLIFSILVAGVFMFFSNEFGMMIYSSEEAGRMIFILAPLIPFMYLDGIIDGMLKGMDEQVTVMKYNIVEALLRVGLVWFIIPYGGSAAFIITIYAGNVINTYLSLRRFIKVGKVKYPFVTQILKSVIAVAVVGFPLSMILKYKGGGNIVTISLIALTVIFYFIIVVATNILPKHEGKILKTLLFGEKEDKKVNNKLKKATL